MVVCGGLPLLLVILGIQMAPGILADNVMLFHMQNLAVWESGHPNLLFTPSSIPYWTATVYQTASKAQGVPFANWVTWHRRWWERATTSKHNPSDFTSHTWY